MEMIEIMNPLKNNKDASSKKRKTDKNICMTPY
jgi:hypothetical protein